MDALVVQVSKPVQNSRHYDSAARNQDQERKEAAVKEGTVRTIASSTASRSGHTVVLPMASRVQW